MKVITRVRKRKREGEPPEESTPEQSTPEQSAPEQSAPEQSAPEQSAPEQSAPEQSAPEQSAPEQSTRGLLRKSAIRKFLKAEFHTPLQIREAFFTAMETKVSEDLRRSVARARELKRNTLMAPDA
jgi:hypothetical protein